MTCPACSKPLLAGQDRCPSCGAVVAPRVEGALAPDPLAPSGKVQPLREIPGLRKRERTWKDEVRERVRHRRREKAGERELPLFRETEDDAQALPPDALPATEEGPFPYATTEKMELGEGPTDLPLRPLEELAARPGEETNPEVEGRAHEEEVPLEREWRFGLEQPPTASRPVERPARFVERMQAAAVDLGLLLGLWAIVVYFAGRAAHVSLRGLLPAWPYLVGYLAFLGLVYAGYFTGTTGQTLGKIMAGLRVVDTAGQPPGYVRAFLRAFLGALGAALLFAGFVPMFFDPARRALHDRILRTRVVKF